MQILGSFVLYVSKSGHYPPIPVAYFVTYLLVASLFRVPLDYLSEVCPMPPNVECWALPLREALLWVHPHRLGCGGFGRPSFLLP